MEKLVSIIKKIFSWLFSIFPIPEGVDQKTFQKIISSDNFLVFFTLIGVHVFYIYGQSWTKHKDKVDYFMYKRAISINVVPSGTYKYLITVYTNWRPGSGTDAKVYIELNGDLGKNATCYFLHNPYWPQRKLFTRSDISWFLLHSSIPVGDIESITIMHDCSGTSNAWHLSKVIVRDLQLKESRRFFAHCWLMDDDHKHPGVTNTVTLKPVSPDYVEPFGERVLEWAQRIYKDRPLTTWYSIDYLTKQSRSQKLMITYVYLFTLMLLDIAYYEKKDTALDQIIFGLSKLFRFGITYGELLVVKLIFSLDLFTTRHPTRNQHHMKQIAYVLLHCLCIFQTFSILLYSVTKNFDRTTSFYWIVTFAFGLLQSELIIAIFVTMFKALVFTLLCKDPFIEETANIQLTERVSKGQHFRFGPIKLPKAK